MWRSLVIGALVCAAACAGSTEPKGPAGTYALVSVADYSLPANLTGVLVRGSTLTLHEDGTFERTLNDSTWAVQNVPPFPTGPLLGTWSVAPVSGGGVVLVLNGAVVGAITESRAELSFIFPGVDPWVYSR